MKSFVLTAMILLSSMVMYGQRESKEVIEAQRVAFITKQLDLTSDESARFWPIYNAYQKEVDILRQRDGDSDGKRSNKNETMTEQEAEVKLATMQIDGQKHLDLKSKLVRDLKGVIPATKIVKLNQADKRFKKKLLGNIAKRRGNGKNRQGQRDTNNGN